MPNLSYLAVETSADRQIQIESHELVWPFRHLEYTKTLSEHPARRYRVNNVIVGVFNPDSSSIN